TPGKIFAISDSTFSPIGFTIRIPSFDDGPYLNRKVIATSQDPNSPSSNVLGIGMTPVAIDGPGPNDIDLGVPALMGQLTTLPGLTSANFTRFGFTVFPAAGGPPVPLAASDWSLTVTPYTAVPEPSCLLVAGLGLSVM